MAAAPFQRTSRIDPHPGHWPRSKWFAPLAEPNGLLFQPSEFVKYLAPAWFIQRFLQLKESFTFREFLKLLGLLAIPIFLIMIEPNNGTAAVILSVLAALFLLTKIPLTWWAVPLLAFALIGGIFAWQLPYVGARLKIYLHPELDLRGKGHQPYQAKIAAGSGQLWGKGPGNSLQKLSYLPESQNDYIAAIFAEEFGFAGISLLLLLYMLLAAAGFYIAYTSEDIRGFYLAACATFLIAFQSFLNLGVVSSLLPSTGLNLPLFSQGGSSPYGQHGRDSPVVQHLRIKKFEELCAEKY